MERPLVIRGSTLGECVTIGVIGGAIFIGSIGGGVAFAVARNRDPVELALSIEFGLFSILAMAGFVRSLKRLGIIWLADDISVRMEKAGKVVWECRWEDYGGWRRKRGRSFLGVAAGYEVLNRAGIVVGTLEIATNGPGDVAYFKRELDRGSPDGGPKPERLPETKPKFRTTPGRCLFLLIGGCLVGLAGVYLHCLFLAAAQDTTSGSDLANWVQAHPNSLLLPMPLDLFGVVFGSLGALGLVRLAHPGMFDSSMRMPVWGPTLEDYLLDRSESLAPVELVEDRRFGYVDPDALTKRLEASLGLGALGQWGCVLMLALAVFIMVLPIPDRPLEPRLNAGACLVGLAVLLVVGMRVWALHVRSRLSVISDRFRLDGPELVVSSGQVERRFDWSSRKKVGRTKNPAFMGFRYLLGDYRLDPRFLIEMPSDPDLAEMAEMRANIEASL